MSRCRRHRSVPLSVSLCRSSTALTIGQASQQPFLLHSRCSQTPNGTGPEKRGRLIDESGTEESCLALHASGASTTSGATDRAPPATRPPASRRASTRTATAPAPRIRPDLTPESGAASRDQRDDEPPADQEQEEEPGADENEDRLDALTCGPPEQHADDGSDRPHGHAGADRCDR